MKRLCIYHIYNKNKYICPYVVYMIRALRQVTYKIVVVCNMESVEAGLQDIEPYAESIFFRENKGYDAGGIKDALCCYIGWEELAQYDELLITNDTYFGPFQPFETLFEKMEKADADFWGLMKYSEGAFPEHVQSYFMDIRADMLHSSDFRYFWENLEYPDSYEAAVWDYEIRFTQFFEEKGFRSTAWNLLTEGYEDRYRHVNASIEYAGDLLELYGFPILKKKALMLANIEQGIKAVGYLKNRTDYPEELWREYFLYPFESSTLEEFVLNHRRVYLYGNGINCRYLRSFFQYKGLVYDGILVTEKKEGEAAEKFIPGGIGDDDGIIVTVTRPSIREEIIDMLLKSGIMERQLYLPMMEEE